MSTALALHAAPAVNTTASLRVLHDTNLYLQDAAPLAAGQTVPALAPQQEATALDAAVSLGATWHRGTETYDLGYTPEVFRYLDHSSENHTDHVVTGAAAFRAGDWIGNVAARYLYTDGSHNAPIYNGLGGGPAIGGEPVRARRAQAIARASGKATRDFHGGFVRGVFSVYDQNFHTHERTTPGYCDYANRDESSVGADLGWRVGRNVALVGGVRTGYQRQADLLGDALNFSNTFTRWLAGIEGAPISTLHFAVLVGPDIRHYGHSVRAGFAREQRTWYGEASASWTPTAADTIALSAKDYLWVVGGGRGAYVDGIVDLTWKHRLARAWTVGLGGNFHDGETGRFNPAAPRHDHIYTGTVGLSHALAHHTHVDLDVMHDVGDSLVPHTPARNYTRWITALTVAHAW